MVDGEKIPSQAGRKEEAMEKHLKVSALPTEAHPAQGESQETPITETCSVRTEGKFVTDYRFEIIIRLLNFDLC